MGLYIINLLATQFGIRRVLIDLLKDPVSRAYDYKIQLAEALLLLHVEYQT